MLSRHKIIVGILVLVVAASAAAWYWQDQSESPSGDLGDGFVYTPFDTYQNTKKMLATNGWVPLVKTEEDPNSAGDANFPEIGECGSGIDMVCTVNFKKGTLEKYLYVQIGGRNKYAEWVVVGDDGVDTQLYLE